MSASSGQGQRFKHSALDLQNHEIRLLKVSNQLSSDGLIQCQIEHACLRSTHVAGGRSQPESATPEYVALSYVWGSPASQHAVLVNGRHFSVRSNLFDFLTRARKKSEWRTWPLWIDAICIDQVNVNERNHQVRLMGSIYSHAKLVYIWLGNSVANEAVSMSPLPAHFGRQVQLWSMNPSLSRKLGLQVGNTLSSRVSILPYWTRAWIIQENLLARERQVLFEDLTLSWDTFRGLVLEASPVASLKAFLDFPKSFSSLTEVYNTFGRKECSEPLDRLYAMIGLQPSGKTFAIDYKCSLPVAAVNIISYCAAEICGSQDGSDQASIDGLVSLTMLSETIATMFRTEAMSGNASYGLDINELPGMSYFTGITMTSMINREQLGMGNGVVTDQGEIVSAAPPYAVGKPAWARYQMPGFHETDLDVNCRLQQTSKWQTSDRWGLEWAIGLILRRNSHDASSYVIVGRAAAHDSVGWAIERYADAGLPKVDVRLQRSEPVPGTVQNTLEWYIAEMDFHDVRPLLIIFGLPLSHEMRMATMQVISQDAQNPAYLPEDIKYGKWTAGPGV